MLHESAIDVFESFIQAKLPSDYRDFLLKTNGQKNGELIFNIAAEGDSVVDYFFPLTSKNPSETLAYKIRLYSGRVPEEMLPIARDPGGNLLLLSLKGKQRGGVFFWDHEMESDGEKEQPYYENIKIVAPKFSDFLKSPH